jgi:inner membrane protein
LRDHRWLTYLTVYLCFATHAMIDAMTVYGTRIFWPIYPDPVGVGSVFIIDPVYSLPLIFVVVWAFFKSDWTQRFGRWVGGVLVATSAYMLLSVGIQAYVEQRAEQIFASQGEVPEKIFAIAAPFSIALWKVIGLDEDRYQNLYLSLFDGDQEPEIYTHSRHPELVACVQNSDAYRKLDWFSRGFNRAEMVDGKVVVSDLRMGLTPGYAFRFAVGEQTDRWHRSDGAGAGLVSAPCRQRRLRLARRAFERAACHTRGRSVRDAGCYAAFRALVLA